jgi:hypothetical protein
MKTVPRSVAKVVKFKKRAAPRRIQPNLMG